MVTLDAPRQEKIAYKAHVAIYEAIADHDPDRAEAAMAAHLRQLEETFWRRRKSATSRERLPADTATSWHSRAAR